MLRASLPNPLPNRVPEMALVARACDAGHWPIQTRLAFLADPLTKLTVLPEAAAAHSAVATVALPHEQPSRQNGYSMP